MQKELISFFLRVLLIALSTNFSVLDRFDAAGVGTIFVRFYGFVTATIGKDFALQLVALSTNLSVLDRFDAAGMGAIFVRFFCFVKILSYQL